MKYYKSPDNQVYAYELDGSQDYLIPSNFVQIIKSELDEIVQAQQEKMQQELLASNQTKDIQIAFLQAQIDALKG